MAADYRQQFTDKAGQGFKPQSPDSAFAANVTDRGILLARESGLVDGVLKNTAGLDEQEQKAEERRKERGNELLQQASEAALETTLQAIEQAVQETERALADLQQEIDDIQAEIDQAQADLDNNAIEITISGKAVKVFYNEERNKFQRQNSEGQLVDLTEAQDAEAREKAKGKKVHTSQNLVNLARIKREAQETSQWMIAQREELDKLNSQLKEGNITEAKAQEVRQRIGEIKETVKARERFLENRKPDIAKTRIGVEVKDIDISADLDEGLGVDSSGLAGNIPEVDGLKAVFETKSLSQSQADILADLDNGLEESPAQVSEADILADLDNGLEESPAQVSEVDILADLDNELGVTPSKPKGPSLV